MVNRWTSCYLLQGKAPGMHSGPVSPDDVRRIPGRAYGRTCVPRSITVTFPINNVRLQLFDDFQLSALDRGLSESFFAVTEGVQMEWLQLRIYFNAET